MLTGIGPVGVSMSYFGPPETSSQPSWDSSDGTLGIGRLCEELDKYLPWFGRGFSCWLSLYPKSAYLSPTMGLTGRQTCLWHLLGQLGYGMES